MKLGVQILSVSVGGILLTSVVAISLQRIAIEKQTEEAVRHEYAVLLDQAHVTIRYFSDLANQDAFRTERLAEDLKSASDVRSTTLYKTIPVVAAWESLAEIAEKEGFQFRVVRNQPRNPENKPDALEKAILDEVARTGADYYKHDYKAGTFTYASPLHFTRDCMTCHGDPKTSPTGDGKDLLGYPMENWRVGEIAGAFILSSSDADLKAMVNQSTWTSIASILPVAVIASILMIWLIRSRVTNPLEAVISELDTSSAEAESAATEISNASQSLAECASEQAATLEETSASLEELSSQTKQNAESASKARHLVEDAISAAASGNDGMRDMLGAMDDIKKSSKQIAQIIKTIDEIAFQTNILALNAAVEAARAGGAGAGFSVVAEEVRSLAQRSAKAADETARLIEESVKKSENGASICGDVSQRIEDIISRINQIEVVAKDVDHSSREQAVGIEELNKAVMEMDKVTQSNASFSEETASAAAEFGAQAEVLRDQVRGLAALLNGANAKESVNVRPSIEKVRNSVQLSKSKPEFSSKADAKKPAIFESPKSSSKQSEKLYSPARPAPKSKPVEVGSSGKNDDDWRDFK